MICVEQGLFLGACGGVMGGNISSGEFFFLSFLFGNTIFIYLFFSFIEKKVMAKITKWDNMVEAIFLCGCDFYIYNKTNWHLLI